MLITPRHFGAATLALVALMFALLASGCGSGSSSASSGVTIEALPPTPAGAIIGGKPSAPITEVTRAPAALEATDTPAPELSPADATSTPLPPTSTPATPLASDGSTAPKEGRWIDVNVTTFAVRLMDGATATRELAPVAVGTEVDTGNFTSTQTGLFHVYNKIADLAYDPPYDTYISDWVGFDPDKANGFHSFLKDKNGKVVNAGTGRISNGCIRTGAADAVFAFAELGMPVWVHH